MEMIILHINYVRINHTPCWNKNVQLYRYYDSTNW